jgi:hypothetical protein
LLDDRTRQGLGEQPTRQDHFQRLAQADLTGGILGDEREGDRQPGPRMLAEFQVAQGLGGRLAAAARQAQREHGRAVERLSWPLQDFARPSLRRIGGLRLDLSEPGLR